MAGEGQTEPEPAPEPKVAATEPRPDGRGGNQYSAANTSTRSTPPQRSPGLMAGEGARRDHQGCPVQRRNGAPA